MTPTTTMLIRELQRPNGILVLVGGSVLSLSVAADFPRAHAKEKCQVQGACSRPSKEKGRSKERAVAGVVLDDIAVVLGK